MSPSRRAPGEANLSGVEVSTPDRPREPPTRKLTATPDTQREVIRLLAGGATNRAIAERYECNPSTVSAFRARHGLDIAALRRGLADAADAEDQLWIANRLDRLTVLQDGLERLLEAIDTAGDDALPELIRAKVTILHEAAEQLGQLPSRMTVASTTVVNYRLGGVDLDAL